MSGSQTLESPSVIEWQRAYSALVKDVKEHLASYPSDTILYVSPAIRDEFRQTTVSPPKPVAPLPPRSSTRPHSPSRSSPEPLQLSPSPAAPAAPVDDARRLLAQAVPSLQLTNAIPSDEQARKGRALTHILLLHGEERPAELELLQNLVRALTEKVAPARLMPASDFSELARPKLLVATGRAIADEPSLHKLSPFPLSGLDHYIQQPQQRRKLWTELVHAYSKARS